MPDLPRADNFSPIGAGFQLCVAVIVILATGSIITRIRRSGRGQIRSSHLEIIADPPDAEFELVC